MELTNLVPIFVVAAVITDDRGRVLLVRKRGASQFIQPGGKREQSESAAVTLARELRQELGVQLLPESLDRLGEFEADAVNERGRRVRAEVFEARIAGEPTPGHEIAEIAWIPPKAPHPFPVAPLSAEHILPRHLARVENDRAA